jgi:hypothetical protein
MVVIMISCCRLLVLANGESCKIKCQRVVYHSCLYMDAIIWPRPMSSDPIDAMQSSDPETK